jgi:hypothetical protein
VVVKNLCYSAKLTNNTVRAHRSEVTVLYEMKKKVTLNSLTIKTVSTILALLWCILSIKQPC